MYVNRTTVMTTPPPTPTREEMIAIVSARPTALQMRAISLAALDRGTTGQGTPAVDGNSSIDVYA